MESLLGLGSHVQTTWLVSLTAQVVALSLAIAAVVQDDVRSAFFSVLVLELIISSIQFVWYCVFFVLIFVRGDASALDNMYRYLDWTLTTPARPRLAPTNRTLPSTPRTAYPVTPPARTDDDRDAQHLDQGLGR